MAQSESIAEQPVVATQANTELPPTPAFNPTRTESTIRPFVYRAPRDPKAAPNAFDRRTTDTLRRR